jgi:hypothetical protein
MEPYMRLPLFFLLVTFAATAAAQGSAKPQEPDKDAQTRIRAQRSAGGLGTITPEERASANAGAGPHLERHTDPARREPREDSAAQGATRDEGLKSGDAARDARRP